MKELSPSGNKIPFIKPFPMSDWEEYNLEDQLSLFEKLDKTGLTPQVLAVVLDETEEGTGMHVMEKINGFELCNFPENMEDFKFSVDFAKKLAYLFDQFYTKGFFQDDPHQENVMYDLDKNKCVFVDLDSVLEVGRYKKTLQSTVFDFSILLARTYLGEDPYDSIVYDEELNKRLFPDGYKNQSPNESEYRIFMKNSREAVLYLMERDGVTEKINPQVREFMLQGINPNTTPQNFEGIISISSYGIETVEKM